MFLPAFLWRSTDVNYFAELLFFLLIIYFTGNSKLFKKPKISVCSCDSWKYSCIWGMCQRRGVISYLKKKKKTHHLIKTVEILLARKWLCVSPQWSSCCEPVSWQGVSAGFGAGGCAGGFPASPAAALRSLWALIVSLPVAWCSLSAVGSSCHTLRFQPPSASVHPICLLSLPTASRTPPRPRPLPLLLVLRFKWLKNILVKSMLRRYGF